MTLYAKLVNSHLWFHLYYKHTKQFKKELEETKARVRKTRQHLGLPKKQEPAK